MPRTGKPIRKKISGCEGLGEEKSVMITTGMVFLLERDYNVLKLTVVMIAQLRIY